MGKFQKILFRGKNSEGEVLLTLIQDETPYFLEGDFGEDVIQMELLDGHVLPVKFEEIFETNDFVILFNNLFYYDHKWYELEKPLKEVKVISVHKPIEQVDEPFELPLNNYLLYNRIQQKGMRRYFGKKFTLFVPNSSDTRSLTQFTTKSIVFSHLVPEKINLHEETQPVEMKSLSGTTIYFNPTKKTVNNSKVVSKIEKSNYNVYIISEYLPVQEAKDNVEYWNGYLNQILEEYLNKKIDTMVYNLNTALECLENASKDKLFGFALLEPETSELLRNIYIQKK